GPWRRSPSVWAAAPRPPAAAPRPAGPLRARPLGACPPPAPGGAAPPRGLRGLQVRELILDVFNQGGGVGFTPAQGGQLVQALLIGPVEGLRQRPGPRIGRGEHH